MLRRFLLGVLSLVAAVSTAAAQETDPELAAMAKLPPLVGTWKGEGWMRRGPGEPERFVGQETVESRLEGRALLIEGKHWTPDRTRLVHNALAILSYDSATDTYLFRSQVTSLPAGNFRGRVEDDAFIWEMPNPRGDIRYVIRVVDDEWIEKGEMKTANGWQQFFEMKLKRETR
jgi:hypothetical protein